MMLRFQATGSPTAAEGILSDGADQPMPVSQGVQRHVRRGGRQHAQGLGSHQRCRADLVAVPRTRLGGRAEQPRRKRSPTPANPADPA